jgi:hypothetical protein
LIEIYNRKADEYFERASYLKKQVLTKPEEGVSDGGGSSAAQKKKYRTLY